MKSSSRVGGGGRVVEIKLGTELRILFLVRNENISCYNAQLTSAFQNEPNAHLYAIFKNDSPLLRRRTSISVCGLSKKKLYRFDQVS